MRILLWHGYLLGGTGSNVYTRQLAREWSRAGHDVTVLHVMDPAERDLPSSGEALFADTESTLTVPASVADVRAAYRKTVEEVIGEWRTMFGSLGIGYEVISTDAPFGVPLRRAFAARQQLP